MGHGHIRLWIHKAMDGDQSRSYIEKENHNTLLTAHSIPKIDPERPADCPYDSDTTFQTLTREDQLTVPMTLTQHSKH